MIYYDKKAKQNLENKLGKVGLNKIEFIPYRDVHDGGDCTPKGDFNYLNYLFDGKSSSEE